MFGMRGYGRVGTTPPTSMPRLLRNPALLALLLIGAVHVLAPDTWATNDRFQDVPTSHWAREFIHELADEGTLKGREQNKFHPQLLVTRAEVAKIVLKTAKIPVNEDLPNPYTDLKSSHSLVDYLLTAFDRDILRPLDASYADPNLPATRFETLRALLVAFDIPFDESGSPEFPDTDPGEETGVANAAKRLGIISGNGGRFLPNYPVTRAEIAKMAVKTRKAVKNGVPSSTPPSSTPPPSTTPPSSIPPTACATDPVRGGALPQLFPSDNWWNQSVAGAPVDANSNAYISFIGATKGLHPDFGGNANSSGSEIYGIPYIAVCGTQALQQITYVDYGDESDLGAPGRPGFPIPDAAKTQNGWIEGGAPGSVSPSGDRHMLIVDRDNMFLYELYRAHWTGNRWEAGSGAVYDLRQNGRRPDGWTSADAAGLAILPGLARYDEVANASAITHAFRVTVRATNNYVWPASHRAGSTSGALPMGARLRLKASKDISSYPAEARKIFQAMKDYGLIVADNGSDMYITGSYDVLWDNDVLNSAFSGLKAGDFEVVQLGWRG